jgi:hypothetical protein
MPAIQRPVWYPPTVMDREASQLLAIRVRTRPAVGGGRPGQFVTAPVVSGLKAPGSAKIGGGSAPYGVNENTGHFA